MSELTARECNGRGYLFMECAETAYMHEPAEDDGEDTHPRSGEPHQTQERDDE